jgi:predicted lipid-binding transport protein (Tim44 family)
MQHWFTAALTATLMAGLTLTLVPTDAEAKRAGGARSSGMQRQTPDKPVQKAPADTNTATPPSGAAAAAPAAAAAAAKAAPAAAARSKWMGPLMGLAAGLGLAALFSSLGMGETFSSIVMIMLLAMVAFAAFRFFMSRRAKAGGTAGASPFAMAGAAAGAGATASSAASQALPSTMARTASDDSRVQIGSALTPPLSVPGLNDGASHVGASAADIAPAARYLPADFDTPAFERIAKTIFVRLQAANDDRNLDDLRAFTTPEMFAELRTDLMERGTAEQKTDVVSVNATVLDFAEEGTQQIISVRYVGVIREEASAPATSFDEVWHLVKERDGGPAWRIAGIQQMG